MKQRLCGADATLGLDDDVIIRLSQPDGLPNLGPGEVKLELKERFSRSKAHAGWTVVIETTDKLTDAQIVAKVTAHFGVDH